MSLTQITSHGIADGAIVNADLHTNAALALSKLDAIGTASSSTFLRGDGAWWPIDVSNLNASNLTSGTVPDARFPSTLPALDGSALTALNASNLASGTVGTARLGSGTASSSTFLRGDGSWQTMSADGGNAATLDSLDSSQFLRSDAHDEFSGQLVSTYSGDEKIILSGSSDPYIRFKEGTTTKSYVQWNASGYLEVVNQEDNSRIKLQDNLVFTNDGWSNTYKIWNESNDGSGSGLDADKLDGSEATKFLSSYDRTTTTGWEDSNRNFRINGGGTDSVGLAMHTSNGTFGYQLYGSGGTTYGFLNANWGGWDIRKVASGELFINNSSMVWHQGNDGAGSGLDADLWDGNQFSSYLNQSVLTTSNVTHAQVIATDWLRTNSNGEGLYNSQSDSHFYSAGNNYWHLNGNSGDITHGGLILYSGYNSSHGNSTGRKGYLYWDVNGFGLLHSGGNWILRGNSSNTDLYGNLRQGGSNTIWHQGNDGSGSGLDADLLDGLHLGTGRNNSANQVVRTNSSGYIDTGYINTSCDDTGTGVDCKFYASQDDYIRYIDLRSMRSVVNSSARSSAYGGRETYTSDQDYWVGSMGHGADNFDSTVWDYGSGAFDVWSNPSGQPSGTSHWCGVQAMHYTNASSRYGMRLMLGAGQTALAYIQGRWGTTTYGWHKLWNEGNDGSGSGLDADTCDGQHLGTSSSVQFGSIFLADDTPIKFGNTDATPDATIDWHTPSWGDRLEISVPNAGDIYYLVNGSGEYHVFKLAGNTVIAMQSKLYLHKDMLPNADNSLDIGSSSKRFDDVYATNGSIQTSDKNEKNTIVDTDLGLSFVNKLKPVSYKFNNKTRTHYGLIAQDVETLLSDISKPTTDFAGFIKTENPDEAYNKLDKEDGEIPEGKDIGDVKKAAFTSYGLRYNEFIAPLIKAVQELSAEVETLKTKVSALESA